MPSITGQHPQLVEIVEGVLAERSHQLVGLARAQLACTADLLRRELQRHVARRYKLRRDLGTWTNCGVSVPNRSQRNSRRDQKPRRHLRSRTRAYAPLKPCARREMHIVDDC